MKFNLTFPNNFITKYLNGTWYSKFKFHLPNLIKNRKKIHRIINFQIFDFHHLLLILKQFTIIILNISNIFNYSTYTKLYPSNLEQTSLQKRKNTITIAQIQSIFNQFFNSLAPLSFSSPVFFPAVFVEGNKPGPFPLLALCVSCRGGTRRGGPIIIAETRTDAKGYVAGYKRGNAPHKATPSRASGSSSSRWWAFLWDDTRRPIPFSCKHRPTVVLPFLSSSSLMEWSEKFNNSWLFSTIVIFRGQVFE